MSLKQSAKPKFLKPAAMDGFETKRKPEPTSFSFCPDCPETIQNCKCKPLAPTLVSPADVAADFASRPAPPKYYYYVTYVATLQQPLPLPMFGAMETYLYEEKIQHAAQLIELHERLKRTLAETKAFQHPIHSLVVTGWTFLRKQ